MNNPLKNKKVLITCGPTWVPIDGVRVFTNRSSGQLGHIIARDLKREGAQLTVLEGPVSDVWFPDSIKVIKFHFYRELDALLHKELEKKYDVIIHLAAVSDYQLKRPYPFKLSSNLKSLPLRFVPTPKLIDKIKKINPRAFLVGFKLEENLTPKALPRKTSRLIQKAKCDLVVVNVFKGERYRAYILDGTYHICAQAHSRKALSRHLIRIFKKRL